MSAEKTKSLLLFEQYRPRFRQISWSSGGVCGFNEYISANSQDRDISFPR